MPLNLGSMFFQLGADTGGLNEADKETRKFARNQQKNFNKVTASAKTVSRAIRGVVTAFIITKTVQYGKRVVMLGDQYNVLQQRIKTATKATGNYVAVSKELERISDATGSSLEVNVGLFQALSRASAELGASDKQMLQLVSTVNKLGIISGATGDAMKFGLRQFTQGLSSGIFRAEEFNSILENIPEVASRIAQSMGMSVGELRMAVLEGKVLSEDVFDALLKQTKQVDKDFQDIEVSIGRAGRTLSNQFFKKTGEFIRMSGASKLIADNLLRAANALRGIDTEGILTTISRNFRRMAIDSRFLVTFWKKGAIERRNAAISALEEEAIAEELHLEQKKARAETEAMIAAEKQNKITEINRAAIEHRQQLEAANAFFMTDLFRKQGKENLSMQATNFRELIGQAAQNSKSFFELNKALAVATALMEAPKAVLSAYKFGSEFGGPIGGAVAAGIATAATSVQVAAISSANFSGGRVSGGSVSPGGFFRVNEEGPEMLSVGGKDFLMMGSQGGNITPNKNLSPAQGGQNVIVNVFPIEGETARVERGGTEEQPEINIFMEQVDEFISNGIRQGGSKTSESLQSTFGLNRAMGAIA